MRTSLSRSVLAAAILSALTAPALAAGDLRQIVVNGEGSIDAAPDYAQITVGATTTGSVAKDVMADNSRAVADVIAAAKAEGVEAKDIKTSSLTIFPIMASGTETITGFRASNAVTIDLRDLTKMGDLIERAVNKGANAVSGIAFLNNNPDGLLDKARPVAFADAKRKAEIYAAASGDKVVRLISLNEIGVMQPRNFAPQGMVMAAGRAAPPPVEAGQNTLSVTVQATFEIGN